MANQTLRDLRQRMNAIYNEALSNGYQLEDILPAGIPKQAPDMSEYIEAIETKEKTLSDEVKRLRDDLKESETKADYVRTAEYDLKQKDIQVEFYRQLARREEKRGDQAKEQHAKALKEIAVLRLAEKRCETIEHNFLEYQKVINRLMDKNDALSTIAKYCGGIDGGITTPGTNLPDALILTLQRQEEDLAKCGEIEKVYIDLLERIEYENNDSANVLNRQTESLRNHDQSLSAAFSEVKKLEEYYGNVSAILDMYQGFFEHLLSRSSEGSKPIPKGLGIKMKDAREDCRNLEALREALGGENLEMGMVREKLHGLIFSASHIQLSLERIMRSVTLFSSELQGVTSTDMWSSIRKKLPFSIRSH